MTSLSLHHNDITIINFITVQHAMCSPPEELLALGQGEGEELTGMQLGHSLPSQLREDLGWLLEGGSHTAHSHVAARRNLEERRAQESRQSPAAPKPSSSASGGSTQEAMGSNPTEDHVIVTMVIVLLHDHSVQCIRWSPS